MKFSNEVYDKLKWVAQLLLPAIGTLYFALAAVWNLPYAEQIVGTVTAVDTFLGAILGISNIQYTKNNLHDGTLLIDQNDINKDIYRLDLNAPLNELKNKKNITLNVDPNAKLNQD